MTRLVLRAQREARIRGGHPWIYRTDVARLDGSWRDDEAVTVVTADGRVLGRGFYNPRPQIVCRLLTRRDEPVDDATLGRCLQAATWAPSGGSWQAWHFVVLRSEENRAAVARAAAISLESIEPLYSMTRPDPDDDSRLARSHRATYEFGGRRHRGRHGGPEPGRVLHAPRAPARGRPPALGRRSRGGPLDGSSPSRDIRLIRS